MWVGIGVLSVASWQLAHWLEVTNSEGPLTRGFLEKGFEAAKSFDSGTIHGIAVDEPGSVFIFAITDSGGRSVNPHNGLKGAGVPIGGKKKGSVAFTFPSVAGVTNCGVEKVPAPGLPEFDEEPEIAEAWQPMQLILVGPLNENCGSAQPPLVVVEEVVV